MATFVNIKDDAGIAAINLDQVVYASWTEKRDRVCLWTSLFDEPLVQDLKSELKPDDQVTRELVYTGETAEQIIRLLEGGGSE